MSIHSLYDSPFPSSLWCAIFKFPQKWLALRLKHLHCLVFTRGIGYDTPLQHLHFSLEDIEGALFSFLPPLGFNTLAFIAGRDTRLRMRAAFLDGDGNFDSFASIGTWEMGSAFSRQAYLLEYLTLADESPYLRRRLIRKWLGPIARICCRKLWKMGLIELLLKMRWSISEIWYEEEPIDVANTMLFVLQNASWFDVTSDREFSTPGNRATSTVEV